jgi:DNA-binding beta-propeller fold protein YncE
MTTTPRHAALFLLALTLAACGKPGAAPEPVAKADLSAEGRLPTGKWLDPEGAQIDVGNFPLAVALSPDGRHAALLLSGWREQGLQVVDRASRSVSQTLPQPAAFLGLAFAPDGRTLYASGGNQDVIYRYDWRDGRAALRDSLMLAPPDTTPAPNPVAPGETRQGTRTGQRYPAQLALSADGRTLYVAENLGDALAVVDVSSGAVRQRFPTERYPYGVVVSPDGAVYVSAWGGTTVSVFEPAGGGLLRDAGRIPAGRHPSALLLSRDGSRLFAASGSTDRVAVIDTRARRLIAELHDAPPAGPSEGSTPNALALSEDGTRLLVAEADANAVAIFALSASTSGVRSATGEDRLLGRVPTGWYPTALAVRGDTLLVVAGKGVGSRPNPGLPQPDQPRPPTSTDYTLGQIQGVVTTIPGAVRADAATLARYSARVARANGWDQKVARGQGGYPPFKHVIYIIKENRTYDQVFGDLPQADGDTSLLFFPRAVSPNHHALAERFGIFDRFFANAEVSADGHNWSTAAYAADYVEKTAPSNYSGRGRSYDYEGTNRGQRVTNETDVNAPGNGYLWDAAERAGITLRNYGEFTHSEVEADGDTIYSGNRPFLAANTNPDFPGYDLNIPDQRRADIWIKELEQFSRRGTMPALQIVRLPNDHTAGARAGMPTPRAYMADNDLALGRMIEALTRSPFWKNTVVFVLEDDAQNGPDHVDSHRSPLLVVSPYNRGGVFHRFANTTDVIATIVEILGMDHLSQYDYYGRPLRDVFQDSPDLRPYVALRPEVPLDEKNPRTGRGATESLKLNLDREDASDDDFFNRILWRAIKGDRPYPGARRAPALELRRGE